MGMTEVLTIRRERKNLPQGAEGWSKARPVSKNEKQEAS